MYKIIYNENVFEENVKSHEKNKKCKKFRKIFQYNLENKNIKYNCT